MISQANGDALSRDSALELNNGVFIPRLGLGVFRSEAGIETENAVRWALEAGYRHIDTARVYMNEVDVGHALSTAELTREDVFVTTKLWNADHGYDQTIAACRESLGRLGLDYIDLYLVHWPVEGLRGESWRAMEQLLADGMVRAIGVSNYMARHLTELLDVCNVVPAVNQFELHPFNWGTRADVIALCREAGIAVEAYSPLTKGFRLHDERLALIASRHGVTPAQALIRWGLQHDLVVIPKSVQRARIVANADVYSFELDVDDMAELDALDEGLITAWDPTDAP